MIYYTKPGKGLYFFGTEMPEGLSAGERASLLEKEAELAKERDAEMRQYQGQQEEERMAREESQRLLTAAQEKERVATLEALEREGAEVSEGLSDEVDQDSAVADMFSALAFGTAPETEEEAPGRPE
jgi:hypothetical protein